MFRKMLLGSAAAVGLVIAGMPASQASADGPHGYRGSRGHHSSHYGNHWNNGHGNWNRGHNSYRNYSPRGYYVVPRSSYRSYYGNPYGSYYGRNYYSPYYGNGLYFGSPGFSFRLGF